MLRRKLFRDIKLNLSQFITIFLMVFLGVTVYSGIKSYMNGMVKTADVFYRENNLQDLEIVGYNFTDEDIDTIKNLKHVNGAERKITLISTMESDEDRTLQLNFIESNNISKFYVVDGINFDINKSGVWLDEYYANHNNLKVGDTITIDYGKISFDEEILGLINIPDHVYDIKDESSIFPNHVDYGFAYLSVNDFPKSFITQQIMEDVDISDEDLIPYYNFKDYLQFNSVIVDVDKEENKNSVKRDILNNVENAIVVSDIKDSFSYSTYQGEIEEGETYVGIFSGLFLFIALLSVITTMTRVVKKQRLQIGTLKALGFSNRSVSLHFIGYGFWISLIASILGLIAGPLLIGNLFIHMEMEYFQIPNGHAVLSGSSFIVAILVVIMVSIVTYFTTRKVLKENPAKTLRLEIPSVKRNSLNITSKGIFKKMNFSTVWNIRDIIRNKARTIMGISGITGCTMLLVCAFGMLDSMNEFINWQFDDLYNFDYKLSLNDNYTDIQYDEIINKYGENTSETLGIEIKNGKRLDANNIFVDNSYNLVRFTDKNSNYIKLNSDGIYVTEKLAMLNNYQIGDEISWHIYGDKKYYKSKIIGFNKDPQNQNITMTREYLESLGIDYKADTVYTNNDLSKVKSIDGISLIQDKNALKDGMNDMLNTMKTMIVLLIIVAALLGSVIIYNMGVLSYTEKNYQFATLKVLGFSDKRIKKIYIKQNNWITIVAIIIGLPLGFFMTDFIFKAALSDTYDFSANIKLVSYVYAVVGTYIVSFVVSKILAFKINKIDMVSSLKGNE